MSKVAVIVGGGQTLGAFLSKGLGDARYDIAVLDLNKENAVNVAKDIENEFGVKAIGYKVDVVNEAEVINIFNKIKNDFGKIDLMIYSAGIAKSKKNY